MEVGDKMEQAGDKMKTMIFYKSSCTKFYKKYKCKVINPALRAG